VELKNNIQIQTNLATTAATMILVVRDNPATTADYAIVSGIISNGPGGACGITKDASGTGLVALTGSNTFTGTFNLNGGVVRARNGVGMPLTPLLNFNGGIWESDADLARTNGGSAGQMRILSGASGFSVHGGGTIRVCFGSLDTPTNMTWDAADMKPAPFILNSIYADGTLDFRSSLTLSTNNSISMTRTVLVSAATAMLSSNITQGTGGAIALEKAGPGVLVLKGSNTWQGGTLVSEGVLLVDNAAGRGTGTGTVTVLSGATLGGTGTVNSLLINASGILAPGHTGVGKLSVSGSATLDANSIVQVDQSGGTADRLEVAGLLTLPVTAIVNVIGSGTLPAPVVILSAGSLSGDVTGWTVTEGYAVRKSGNTVLLGNAGAGTLMMIR
jgi:fibronectin-binding autotransporter adhesin